MALLLLENPLDSSPLIFPVLECFHIIGMAVLVGTIALVDFSVLGMGVRRQSAAEVAANVGPWTIVGLAVTLLAGCGLFLSDPDMYYLNHAFQLKMVFLLLAIVFNYTVRRKMVAEGASGKGVAWISLALWASVIFGAIFIAFI